MKSHRRREILYIPGDFTHVGIFILILIYTVGVVGHLASGCLKSYECILIGNTIIFKMMILFVVIYATWLIYHSLKK